MFSWRDFYVCYGGKDSGITTRKKATQKEIAEGIGVSPVSVQRFEYDSVHPSLDTLTALADFFDVSLDDLVGRSDDLRRLP